MLTETLTEGLDQYEIGRKLRRLRLRKGLGLVELGQHSGLSPAMISKIERGKLYPTLPTLLRLSLVFSVGLDHFFIPEPQPVLAIVRKSERLRFPEKPNGDRGGISYHFESLDYPAVERKLSGYLAIFEPLPEGADRPTIHQHEGYELLYMIKGKIDLYIGDDRHRLEAGDSVYFDSGEEHGYARIGDGDATAVVVTVP